jgi:heme/copper-type cytochrome/quinol oxidase subunit 1
MRFQSMRAQYERGQRIRTLQLWLSVATAVAFVAGQGMAVVIGVAVITALQGMRNIARGFFWNQAMSLHSSKAEGTPDIHEWMTPADRRKHSRQSYERFKPKQ